MWKHHNPPAPPIWTPERVKHLEFIQSAISRQASHSFAAKGWSLTVAAVLYAYTAANLTWWMALIALFPSFTFAYLDLFFLRQERLFRQLYDEARLARTTVAIFDMDTRRYFDAAAYPNCAFKSACKSRPWRWLHGTILGVGVLLLAVAIGQVLGAADLPNCICDLMQL